MGFINTATVLALAAVSTIAAPADKRWGPPGDHGGPGGPGHWQGWKDCMTYEQAQKVVNNYGVLLSNYSNSSANAFLAPDFTDYSESVTTLIDTCPVGSAAVTIPLLPPTFTNRQSFEAGQGQQAGINFKPLSVWNTCNTAIARWETTATGIRPVVGNLILEVVAGNGTEPWVIGTVYSEFDSGAWLQNIKDAGGCSNLDPSTSTGK